MSDTEKLIKSAGIKMRHPWINTRYTKRGEKRWLVWYWDGTRQVSRTFRERKLAEHYKSVLYHKLNSDVFVSVIKASHAFVKFEYLQHYRLEGLRDSSREQSEYTFKQWERIVGDVPPHKITKHHINKFIQSRLNDGMSNYTINKDLSNIRAYLNFCKENHYATEPPKIKKLKTEAVTPNILTIDQIRRLVLACPTPEWQWVVILSAVTGLRKTDIDTLMIDDIDFSDRSIKGVALKTRKPYDIPLPVNLVGPLKAYCKSLTHSRLFKLKNSYAMWQTICGTAGVTATRQDLRRTCSDLIQQACVGQGFAQGMLQHADPTTTAQFYTGSGLRRLVVEYVWGSIDWPLL